LRIRVGGLQFSGLNGIGEIDFILKRILEDSYDLFILPENWLSKRPVPVELYKDLISRLSVEGGTYVLGVQYVIEEGSLKSSGFLGTPSGDVIKACEKVFPSKSVGERFIIVNGSLLEPVNVLSVNVGCISCVDIFYPEIARYLSLRGAQVIVNPSSISRDRVHMWRSVLLARSVENVVFLVGINKTQSLYPGDKVTGGGSLVADPEGNFISSLDERPGILKASIDTSVIESVEFRRGFRKDLLKILGRWSVDPLALKLSVRRPIYNDF